MTSIEKFNEIHSDLSHCNELFEKLGVRNITEANGRIIHCKIRISLSSMPYPVGYI